MTPSTNIPTPSAEEWPAPVSLRVLCDLVVELGTARENIIPEVRIYDDGTYRLYATKGRPPVYLGEVSKVFHSTLEVDREISSAGRFVLVRWTGGNNATPAR